MLLLTLARALSRLGLGAHGEDPFPAALRPMVATLGRHAFNSPDWLYEPGWDGRRVLAEVRDGRVRMWDQDRRDVTASLPTIARACRGCPTSLILDGEVVALDPRGMPNADVPRVALGSRPPGARVPLVYMAFDCLYVHGHTLLERPLEFRRDALRALKPAVDDAHVRITDPLEGVDGRVLFRQSVRLGLPGVVAKRRGSTYQPGARSPDWIRIPARPREELMVGGFLRGPHRRLERLILGRFDADRRLRYAGLADVGSDEVRHDLESLLKALARKTCPLVPKPVLADAHGAVLTGPAPHWVKPAVVAEVEVETRTPDGLIHARAVEARLDGR